MELTIIDATTKIILHQIWFDMLDANTFTYILSNCSDGDCIANLFILDDNLNYDDTFTALASFLDKHNLDNVKIS